MGATVLQTFGMSIFMTVVGVFFYTTTQVNNLQGSMRKKGNKNHSCPKSALKKMGMMRGKISTK
jgi:hypothetical protein